MRANALGNPLQPSSRCAIHLDQLSDVMKFDTIGDHGTLNVMNRDIPMAIFELGVDFGKENPFQLW